VVVAFLDPWRKETDTPAAWKAIEAVSKNDKDTMNQGTARWYLQQRK
jgi:hypothetical protein